MILDMPTATYTLVHIIISLIGIGSGFLVMFGLLTARRFDGATALFLVTTVLTSVTGFGFPFDHLLPSHLIAILARYVFHMAGAWRARYVIGATLALYLNLFVFVAQLFQKVPALKVLAPTQKEPPFLLAQLVVLLIFLSLTVLAAKKFQVEPVRVS